MPTKALERWDSINTDKQAGYLAGVTRRITYDMEAQKAADAHRMAVAHAAYYERARQEAGQLNLSPEQQDVTTAAGYVPMRTSDRSFQYVKDPNNPINQQAPVPIDEYGQEVDRNDPNAKVFGLKHPNGVITRIPKSKVQELKDAATQPSSTATPTPKVTPSATPGAGRPGQVHVQAPDGSAGWIPAERLDDYIAAGYKALQ